MPNCLLWREVQQKQCTEWHEEQQQQCDDWDKDCCDWPPCSWACDAFTWVCVAWVWVTTLVCVAWTWVTVSICVLTDVIVTVIGAVVTTLESTLGWLLDIAAVFVEFLFEIPYLGRIIKWVWQIVLISVWLIPSALDFILTILGIRPEKKLRICTVRLRDEKGEPIADKALIVDMLRLAAKIYREEANVRLVRLAPFEYDSGFSADETPDESWIQTAPDPGTPGILDVPCQIAGLGADAGETGTKLDFLSSTMCFFGAWRRITGYGAPVTCFVIRTVPYQGDPCGMWGCALWITDYVTVRKQPCASDPPVGNRPVLAHEVGHACNLWHVNDTAHPTNLMGDPWHDYDPLAQVKLTNWQVALLRASKHVSYL